MSNEETQVDVELNIVEKLESSESNESDIDDSKEIKKQEKNSWSWLKAKIKEDLERKGPIVFAKDIVFLINGTIILSHLINSGVLLGGNLRLLQPRNTFVRTDKEICLNFEYAADDKSINQDLDYKISLSEVDGDIVWGPFKQSKKIDTKEFIVTHLLDHKNLTSNKSYRWTVKTPEKTKSSTFRVLDNASLNYLQEVELQVEDRLEDSNKEKYLILGALYERAGLYDDAIEKYMYLEKIDPSLIITKKRISTVYAKKACKFYIYPGEDKFIKEIRELAKLANGELRINTEEIENRLNEIFHKKIGDDGDLAREADDWMKKWERYRKMKS
jgi:tetratricopeptide (TPR) repeat protein